MLFYIPNYIVRYQNLPGISQLLSYFKIYGHWVAPVDRSGTLEFPVRMKSLFPLPQMRAFTKTYEEVCNERAQELLDRADKLNTLLYVFWSGGIDSTCLLVSLLKTRRTGRIVVLMSEESIAENPVFYYKYIRGKLRRDSASLFPYILGTKNLIVNGEHNDQLFGSDIIADVVNRFGFDIICEPYNRQLFLTFFLEKMEGDQKAARLYVDLFERLKEAAPVQLHTNYDVFWWINFSIKWQTVYMRMLCFVAQRNAKLLSAKYLQSYYAPFYNTEDFQLWSMNNPRQKVKDGWHSYKWPAKEVIYEFTKDVDYRDNKIKRGSLQYLIQQQVPFNFIDDKFVFRKDVAPEKFYEPDNCMRSGA